MDNVGNRTARAAVVAVVLLASVRIVRATRRKKQIIGLHVDGAAGAGIRPKGRNEVVPAVQIVWGRRFG